MAAQPARRLSPTDATWLYFERPGVPLHAGSLGIYQDDISYERLVSHLQSRMHTIPRYRQRVSFVPLNLGHPTWEDDPHFDIRRHVKQHRARGPISDARLRKIASELFAPAMERDRPLWDVTLIRGLTGGRSALLCRAHHSMVDGVSGLELLVALLDFKKTPREVEPPDGEWKPRPEPAPREKVADALWEMLSQQVRLWNELPLMATDARAPALRVATVARAFAKALPFFLQPAPAAHFTAPLKAKRALAWTETPFADVRAIRGALGGTVNDVVLAILAGALTRYLPRHSNDGRLPPLRVLIPVNVRTEDEQGTLGNRISFMLAQLPLDVSDPVRRLRIVRRRVQSLKAVHQAEGVDMLAQVIGMGPPALTAAAAPLVKLPNTLSNLVCTNVAGPMVPLWCAGHRLLEHYPLAPITWDMGVNVGVMSYNQALYWGLVANAAVMPDPERLARDIDDAFVELRRAAGVSPREEPDVGSAPPRAPRRTGRRAPAAKPAGNRNGRAAEAKLAAAIRRNGRHRPEPEPALAAAPTA